MITGNQVEKLIKYLQEQTLEMAALKSGMDEKSTASHDDLCEICGPGNRYS